MKELIFGILGLGMGLLLSGIFFNRRNTVLKDELTQAEAERNMLQIQMESDKHLYEEKERFLNRSTEELKGAFAALSNKALSDNSESFLTLAKTALEKQQVKGTMGLEQKEEAIKHLVGPMKEMLEKVQVKMEAIEKDHQSTFAEVKEQVRSMKEDGAKLQLETASLVKALRAPQTRGRWGEIQLKRVVEMAGMINHVDFIEQDSTDTETGKLRPDMLIRLPGNKIIVIDAKTPLAAYLDMLEATDEDQRLRLLKDHGRQVKDHIAKLSGKSYWDQFPESPEFVVLFLPNEALYGAALEAEPQLIELGAGKNVILATPTTLIALLKAVSYGWNQERLAENANKISQLGKDLYDRVATFVDHMEGIKKGLERSVESYNKAVGAFESRILPSARRFKELGVSTDKEIQDMEQIERTTKEINKPD